MGFPRQEFWSGLPFPSPRNFPNQGLNPRLLRGQADSLPLSHLGSHMVRISMQNKVRQATQRPEREKRKEKGLISEVPRGFHQSLTPKLTSVSLGLYSKEKVTSGWPVDVILERSSSRKKDLITIIKLLGNQQQASFASNAIACQPRSNASKSGPYDLKTQRLKYVIILHSSLKKGEIMAPKTQTSWLSYPLKMGHFTCLHLLLLFGCVCVNVVSD